MVAAEDGEGMAQESHKNIAVLTKGEADLKTHPIGLEKRK